MSQTFRITRALLACGIATAFVLSAPVHSAEDGAKYPSKAIRFIVPFPPGGGNDTIARLVGQQMAATFGQQVTIDNRPGAAGARGRNWPPRRLWTGTPYSSPAWAAMDSIPI